NPALCVPKRILKPAPVPAGLAYYDAMDLLTAANPPPKSERKLMRQFASIGIGPGRTPSTEYLDQATRKGLLEGLKLGRKQIARYARRLNARSRRAHNGWLVPPKRIGNYGHKYLLRAYVAIYA